MKRKLREGLTPTMPAATPSRGPRWPSARSAAIRRFRAGDKAYSYPRVRRYLRRREIVVVIPTRKDQRRNPRFDRATYRRHNVVERCVNC